MYQDKNMDWARQRLVIPATSFTAYAGTAASLSDDVANIAEVGDFGYSALAFSAADQAAVHTMKVPSDWDIVSHTGRTIGLTLEWSTPSDTSTDAFQWQIQSQRIELGQAVVDAGDGLTNATMGGINRVTIGSGATAH